MNDPKVVMLVIEIKGMVELHHRISWTDNY